MVCNFKWFLILYIVVFLNLINTGFIAGQQGGRFLDYNTRITVAGGYLIEERSYLIEISSKLSEELSNITIPYNNLSKPEIIEAVVLNSRGDIVRKLNKKEIETRSDISESSLYEDDYVMEFNLRWHEFPYRIRYSYRKKLNQFIYLSAWSPAVLSEMPTLRASLEVFIPFGYKYRTFSRGEFKFSIDTIEKKIHLKWDSAGYHPAAEEIYSPPYRDLVPQVLIVPETFFYGIPGTLDSWKTLGEWHSELNKNLFELTTAEKSRADSIIKGISDRKEIARRLYYYMQDNTRYVNVSIDIGGLKPFPASYVCNNKYGDCKALTIYMMALLRYANINSYYTSIFAGQNPASLVREFPAPQFNHVILFIPFEKDTIWLENTSKQIPFGYLGTFTQNRYGLAANGDRSQLIKTHSLDADDVKMNSVYEFLPYPDGPCNIKFSRNAKGFEFELLLPLLNSYYEDRRTDYIKEVLPSNSRVASISIKHDDRDDKSISILAEANSDRVLRKVGDNLVFNFIPLRLPDFETPADRNNPAVIRFPVCQYDSVILDISNFAGCEIQVSPGTMIEAEPGRFEIKYEKEKERIIALYNYELYPGEYSGDNYKKLYEFIDSVKKVIKQSGIVITPLK